MNAQTKQPRMTVNTSDILWHLDVIRHKDMVAIIIYDQYSNQAFMRIMPQHDYIPMVMQNFVLMTIINHHKPHKIISDNGIQFTGKEFQKFLKRNEIEHENYSPLQPKKGKCEWIVKTLEPILRDTKKEFILKVDIDKGQANIVKEGTDPFREAMLNLHIRIQADIDIMRTEGMKGYARLVLRNIEEMCRAIDPDLFKKEES